MTTERKTAFINDRVAGVRLNRTQQSQESGGGEADRGGTKPDRKHNRQHKDSKNKPKNTIHPDSIAHLLSTWLHTK